MTLSRQEIEELANRVEEHVKLLPHILRGPDIELLVAFARATLKAGFPVDQIAIDQ
jgi:hypothetical protein